MKLRLRSSQSKEILRIEAPNSCTLSQLKQIISHTLSDSPSPASIRLSLNRKDELQSDGEEHLNSLGVAAGDLIFYTIDQPTAGTSSSSGNNPLPDSVSASERDSRALECSPSLIMLPEVEKSDTVVLDSQKRKSPEKSTQVEDTEMEIDADSGVPDGFSVEIVDKSYSVPGFLRKVFVEELGEDSGRDHKLIVIAVHAVMLESGFVCFDPNGLRLQGKRPSGMFTLSLFYSLPDILNANGDGGDTIKCVVKFQSIGKFINVYGSLSGGKTSTHFLPLNEEQLVPFLNVVWANCGVGDNVMGDGGNFDGTSPEKEVFTFWRGAKDKLALPLLIDICEKAGLGLPPCFMGLPTDIKMKILESLPGFDLAKVSLVCSELRYLASNDDLWKMKFEKECGDKQIKGLGSWKMAFVRAWKDRKSINLFANRVGSTRAPHMPWWGRPQFPLRGPQMPWMPHVVGGDYDIYGDHVPGNNIHTMLHHRANRNFSPRCNLGGSRSWI